MSGAQRGNGSAPTENQGGNVKIKNEMKYENSIRVFTAPHGYNFERIYIFESGKHF